MPRPKPELSGFKEWGQTGEYHQDDDHVSDTWVLYTGYMDPRVVLHNDPRTPLVPPWNDQEDNPER